MSIRRHDLDEIWTIAIVTAAYIAAMLLVLAVGAFLLSINS